MPAAEQYSYVFDGNAQILDHVLVTQSLAPYVSGFEWARDNADFPETMRSDGTRPERISDHDGAVAYLRATPPDVTALVRITRLPFVFNPLTRVSLSVIAVTNRGPAPIAGPIHLVFGDLGPGLRLLDAQRRHRRRSVPDAERPEVEARRDVVAAGAVRQPRARAGDVHAAGAGGRVLVLLAVGPLRPDRARPWRAGRRKLSFDATEPTVRLSESRLQRQLDLEGLRLHRAFEGVLVPAAEYRLTQPALERAGPVGGKA